MRYLQILTLVFLLGCQNTSKIPSRDLTSNLGAISDKANTYLTKLTELKQFNGVVLLRKNGEIVLKEAYNYQKDTVSSLYVTKSSQFDLRSIAKLFAKVSILKLEKEGKMDKETKLDTYMPNFPNANKMTIYQIMENRSGLPRKFKESSKRKVDLSRDEVIDLAGRSDLEFEPGTTERYSNVGFQILYYALGKVTESTFEKYLQDHIFEPLGMSNSGSNFYAGKDRKTTYAYGHYLNDNKEIICECSFPDDEMRMGNLFSTLDDMDKFLIHLDSVNHKDLIYNGSISHAGGTRGKRAYIERSFVDDYSLVFLTNYDEIPFQSIVKDLQAILKQEPINMPEKVERKAIKVSPNVLKIYEGTYDIVDAGHILLSIQLENDSLFVYQKGQNNGVLYPESERVFFGDQSSKESIEFVKNDNGEFDMLIDMQGVQWKAIKIKL